MLHRKAPAKINLWLRVLGRRTDGYHEIESLVARLGFCDDVTVDRTSDGILRVTCTDPAVPCDDTNLVIRAALAMRELARETGRAAGVGGAAFHLDKRIPPGAGLGGGSSNAAAALRLLNELWEVGASDAELAQLGGHIGTDVPLFFRAPLCRLRGRGDQVDDAGDPPPLWVALVLAPVRCPTPDVYAAWSRCPPTAPGPEGPVSLRGSAADLMTRLFNDLEQAACAVQPALRTWIRRIQQHTGCVVRMTGSGAGLFRLFDDQESGRRFAESAAELGVRVELTQLERGPA